MNEPVIDLRSDTVTRPTPQMRRAMAEAEVGDDVLGDDPTVIRLQDRIAALLGKQAACFVPSGTMANQTAIRAHTEPGDEIVCHKDSHIIHYETGAPAALSGCMVRALDGPNGLFEAADVAAVVRPRAIHFPQSALVVVENTHNRGGGSVWPITLLAGVAACAREHGLKLHLDGARIWNACASTGLPPAEYARHFDTVSCCFSKGLGAPVGSAVAGDEQTITRVRRFRKMFGGAMRQSGILAAAALYALDHHRDRLSEDHTNARRFAEGLASVPGIKVDLAAVATNMVFFDIERSLGTGAQFAAALEREGVRTLSTAPQRIRAVTHLDVSAGMIEQAIAAVSRCAASGSRLQHA